jgi:CHAT domain-containing protein
MIRFYRLWQKDGLEPVYALRAAQRWLRDATNQDRADYFERFRPRVASALRMPGEAAAGLYTKAMIHKEGPDARSFSHPFWWSAFYLTGV